MQKNTYAPVAYICFNRPQTVEHTLKALCNALLAKESDLHIFLDAPRHEGDIEGINAVRALCECDYVQSSFASVTMHISQVNLGGTESQRNAVRTMCKLSDRFIFLEDDVLFSPYALTWFNQALEKYKDNPPVFSITAWRPPAMRIPHNYPWDGFFIPRCHIWGWASWADRMNSVDWTAKEALHFEANPYLVRAFNEGGADLAHMLASTMRAPILGWDIVMDFSRFARNGISLLPCKPYSMNIGTDISSMGSSSVNILGQDIALAKAEARLPDVIFVDANLKQEHLLGIEHLYQPPAHANTSAKQTEQLYRANPWLADENSSTWQIIQKTPHAGKILDVGCGCGDMGEYLHAQCCAFVWGIEWSAENIAIALAHKAYENIVQADIQSMQANQYFGDAFFDCLIFSDVLEHLTNPKEVVNNFIPCLKSDGYFAFSIPNITHGSILLQLMQNRFDYMDFGILDTNHLRFFSAFTIAKLFAELHLEIFDVSHTILDLPGWHENNNLSLQPAAIIKHIASLESAYILQYVFCARLTEKENLYNHNIAQLQSYAPATLARIGQLQKKYT